ncbi:MAG: hypothetical protein ABFS32_17165 [Bacteroidota bacterium]
MPTFSDSFDGTYPMDDYQYKTGYLDISNHVAEGRLNVYMAENYSCSGFCYGKTRFAENVTWEICFSVTDLLETVSSCHIGFAQFDDKNYFDEIIRIHYENATEVDLRFATVQKIVAQGTKVWCKLVQISEAGQVEVWYKEDGGSYELLRNDWTVPYFVNPEGCVWGAFMLYSTSFPNHWVMIWDMNTTADYIANLAMDNWPTRMTMSARALQIDTNSALAPYVPEPTYDFEEDFNDPYDPNNIYYKTANIAVENSALNIYHAEGSGDESEQWYIIDDEYFAREIEFIARFKIRSLSTDVHFYIYLYDPDWNYCYYFRFLGSATHGQYDMRAYTHAVGVSQEVFNWVDFALFTEEWYEVKVKENADSTTSFYIRQEGFAWHLLGNIGPLSVSPLHYGMRPRFIMDTYGTGRDEVPQNIEIDGFKVNSLFSTLGFNWFGAVEATAENLYGHFIAGWSMYTAYDWSDFSDTLNELDFSAPLPAYTVYPGSYLKLSDTNPGDLKLFATIKNNFVFDTTFDFVMDPTEAQPYLAWRFYINDIEIWFGHHYDGVQDRAGVCINGTWYYHSDITWNYTSSNRFIFSLSGNELTVTIQQSTAAAETVYSDSDFLGSPAEYITRDFTYIRSEGVEFEYTRINSLYLLAEETLPTDLEGWLTNSFEEIITEFIVFLSPPDISDPGFFFHRTDLVGGTEGALDSIDPTNLDGTGQVLTDSSACLVITATNDIYLFKASSAPGQVESIPDIIIPDNNPGDWYWERIHSPQFRPVTPLNFTDVTVNEILSMPAECKEDIPFPITRSSVTSEVYQSQIKVEDEGTVLRSSYAADKFIVWFVPVIALKAEPE